MIWPICPALASMPASAPRQRRRAQGITGDDGAATSALLNNPVGVAVDGSGNVFIADYANHRVQEVPAATGGGMTAGDMYTIAGSAAGTSGHSGNGGPAASALLDFPADVAADAAGDVYIADSGNNRIQEIYVSGGAKWGQAMTAGDIYTIAGQARRRADGPRLHRDAHRPRRKRRSRRCRVRPGRS
jgi:hypothetical protein